MKVSLSGPSHVRAHPRRRQRFREIDVHATTTAGLVTIGVIIAAFIVAMARGEDEAPYTWLGAIAGVTSLVAVLALQARR